MHTILLPLIFWRRGPYRSKTFYSTFAKKKRWPFTFLNLTSPLTLDKVNLTQSINKGHGYHTMVRELSMVQVAHFGPTQVQLAHIQCWGHWGLWWGSGGV